MYPELAYIYPELADMYPELANREYPAMYEKRSAVPQQFGTPYYNK